MDKLSPCWRRKLNAFLKYSKFLYTIVIIAILAGITAAAQASPLQIAPAHQGEVVAITAGIETVNDSHRNPLTFDSSAPASNANLFCEIATGTQGNSEVLPSSENAAGTEPSWFVPFRRPDPLQYSKEMIVSTVMTNDQAVLGKNLTL